MIPLWKGVVNPWDCDDMGHANVRFMLEKAYEGLGAFADAISMHHAFRPNAPSTLLPVSQHIRYVHEAMSGNPLLMTGRVTSISEDHAELYQDIRHSDQRPAAALRTMLAHVEAKSGRPFKWSKRSQAALSDLVGTPPEDLKPRSLDPDKARLELSSSFLSSAISNGALESGRGMILPEHCDVFGRMRNSYFIARVSDSVPTLIDGWRRALTNSGDGFITGSAVVEFQFEFHKWPRAGDRFVIHSSYTPRTGKTYSLTHWILDPVSGEAYAIARGTALFFDLKTRKALQAPKERLEELEKVMPGNLPF